MELLFRSSASFEDDMSRLEEGERTALIRKMNELFPDYLCDRDSFCSLLESPHDPGLKHGFCSSLSILPITGGLSLILTIDDDPIFDQTIITLIRLIEASESSRIFHEVQERLQCSYLAQSPHAPGGS
jgi:hypothetical protein